MSREGDLLQQVLCEVGDWKDTQAAQVLGCVIQGTSGSPGHDSLMGCDMYITVDQG